MNNNLQTIRRRLEMQGYIGLSDETLAEVGPWARLATGICMVWVAGATALGSATLVWTLIPVAVLGATLPWHPFDLLYNHGIRHLTHTKALPKHGKPRRFACAIATVWLGATGWSFYTGLTILGYVLGIILALTASVPTFTDFCIPSFFYGLIFGKAAAK